MPDLSRPFSIEVRQSPFHGRGLFATVAIAANDLIGEYPLLVLSHDDTAAISTTLLHHYVFYVDEVENGRMRAAVAFGAISMCNHSADANAVFQIDADQQIVKLSAARDIAVNQEIFIDYEEFAAEII